MTEPLYFNENNLKFYFAFSSPLDPRLGHFELTQVSYNYTDYQVGDNPD